VAPGSRLIRKAVRRQGNGVLRQLWPKSIFGHHFMMEWRLKGMLKYTVNKNLIKVVVFIEKTIFTTNGFCL
jgi:hypothetical protein